MSDLPEEAGAPIPAPIPSADGSDYQKTGRASYEFVADKIGFVPNVRRSDNQLQAKIFGGVWLACIIIGSALAGGDGFLLGALFGIVIALLISGAVLTVIGLRRK